MEALVKTSRLLENKRGGICGSGTRSSLMYETIRIVGKIRPKYILWENVKNILSNKHKHNFDAYIETMNILGYNSYYQVLNAKDYGIPQNRERVFTISIRKDIDKGSFKFPEKEELKLRLKDMLEDEVDEKYYLSDDKVSKIQTSNFMQEKKRIQDKKYSDTILARDYKDPKCVRVGGIFDTEKSKHQAGSIYDKEGLAPILDSMQGGWRQPMIEVIGNYSPSGHDASRIVNPNGLTPTVKENHGTVTAIMTPKVTNNDKRLKALVEKTQFKEGKVLNLDTYNQTTNENLSQTLTEPHHNTQRLFDGYRIRKLTPLECWRLMGFDDEDFYSAKYGCKIDKETAFNLTNKITAKIKYEIKNRKSKMSNTQLYKQAGNSIVINVLEKIFIKLFMED